MKNLPNFDDYLNESNNTKLVDDLSKILGPKVTKDEIMQIVYPEVDEWGANIFNNLMKGLFINPMKKRQINKLEDELVKVQVELVKLRLEGDKIEDLKDELEEAYKPPKKKSGFSSRKKSFGSSSAESAYDIKIETLEDQKDSIETKMDLLAADDEKLQKFVEAKKLSARIRANELTIKLADSEQARIIKQLISKDKKGVEAYSDEIKS